MDLPLITKATSPNKSYQPERQKKYYHEAAKLFKGVIEMKEDRKHNGHMLQ